MPYQSLDLKVDLQGVSKCWNTHIACKSSDQRRSGWRHPKPISMKTLCVFAYWFTAALHLEYIYILRNVKYMRTLVDLLDIHLVTNYTKPNLPFMLQFMVLSDNSCIARVDICNIVIQALGVVRELFLIVILLVYAHHGRQHQLIAVRSMRWEFKQQRVHMACQNGAAYNRIIILYIKSLKCNDIMQTLFFNTLMTNDSICFENVYIITTIWCWYSCYMQTYSCKQVAQADGFQIEQFSCFWRFVITRCTSPICTHIVKYWLVIRAQIKENIKAPRNWPLCGEFTGDRWIRRTNGQ